MDYMDRYSKDLESIEAELAKLQTEKAALQAELRQVVEAGQGQVQQPTAQQTLAQLFPSIARAAAIYPAIQETANGIAGMLQKLEDDIRQVIAAGQAEDGQQQQQHMQMVHEQAAKGQKRASDSTNEATIEAMLEMAEGLPEGQPKQTILEAARAAKEATQQRRPNPAGAAEHKG